MNKTAMFCAGFLAIALLAGCDSEGAARAKYLAAAERLRASDPQEPEETTEALIFAKATYESIIKEYPRTETAVKAQDEAQKVDEQLSDMKAKLEDALMERFLTLAATVPYRPMEGNQVSRGLEQAMNQNPAMQKEREQIEKWFPGTWDNQVTFAQTRFSFRKAQEMMQEDAVRQQKAQYEKIKKAYGIK